MSQLKLIVLLDVSKVLRELLSLRLAWCFGQNVLKLVSLLNLLLNVASLFHHKALMGLVYV